MFGLFKSRPRTPDVRPLTEIFCVGPQIKPANVTELARRNVALVINCRPDGEMPGQPSAAQIGQACEAAGLSYEAVPVAGVIASQAIATFRDVMDAHDGLVFAYCRSGLRAVKLWALANPEGLDVNAIMRLVDRAGFDISPLSPELHARAGQ